MSKYVYFVSFNYPQGHGNREITCLDPIKSMRDLKEITSLIQEETGLTDIVILNYQLMRTEQ